MFRKDRMEGSHGGVAIYLHDSFEAEVIGEMTHKKCKMLAIHIKELNIVNIVIYRPPAVSYTHLTLPTSVTV